MALYYSMITVAFLITHLKEKLRCFFFFNLFLYQKWKSKSMKGWGNLYFFEEQENIPLDFFFLPLSELNSPHDSFTALPGP